jgi:hypothetical protein
MSLFRSNGRHAPKPFVERVALSTTLNCVCGAVFHPALPGRGGKAKQAIGVKGIRLQHE